MAHSPVNCSLAARFYELFWISLSWVGKTSGGRVPIVGQLKLACCAEVNYWCSPGSISGWNLPAQCAQWRPPDSCRHLGQVSRKPTEGPSWLSNEVKWQILMSLVSVFLPAQIVDKQQLQWWQCCQPVFLVNVSFREGPRKLGLFRNCARARFVA